MSSKKKLTVQEKDFILKVLELRFADIKPRFENLKWDDIQHKLEQHPDKLWALSEMEKSGGEPNLLEFDKIQKKFIFCDFSPESPAGRRSLCYDHNAWESRKKNKPKDSAQNIASKMGVALMNEADYRKLQEHGAVDTKTSSWLQSPEEVRNLGGAIFGDHRFGRIFIYHNGAESYYAGRGFRAKVSV